MRITTALFYLCLLFTFIFQSCSIEKRRYTSGYSLQWKQSNHTLKTNNPDPNLTSVKKEIKKEVVTPTLKRPILLHEKISELTASTVKKQGIVLFVPDSSGCDTIIMRDEAEIKAKVIEITPTEIKYKFCDNISGPTYVVYRYNVSYIKYANGKLDSFKNEFAPPAKRIENNESIEERQVRNMSMTGLVFGIVSIFLFVAFLISITAIILGSLSLSKIGKDLSLLRYKNRAIAALILGIISFLLFFLFILAIAGVI